MIRTTAAVLVQNSGPVRGSLSYYLNSFLPNSYPGSGITWNDLSPINLTTTLYNTPTYTNGILSFSASTFEYAETNSNHPDFNQWTVEVWVKFNRSLTGVVSAVICGEFNLLDKLNFSIGTNNAPTTYDIRVGFFDGSWRNVPSGLTPTLGQWYHIIGTYDGSTIKMYVGGELLSQFSYTGTPQSGGKIRVGRRWDLSDVDATNFIGADIPIVRVYSRALTADEIRKNYTGELNLFS